MAERRVWLSPRECEVLQLLAKRESFKWIAYVLGISEGNAYWSASRAYRKLGIAGRGEVEDVHPWHEPTPNLRCPVIVRSESGNDGGRST